MWQRVSSELKDKLNGTILSGVPPPAPDHLKFEIPEKESNYSTNSIEYEQEMLNLLADDLPKDKSQPIVLELECCEEFTDFKETENRLYTALSQRTGHITVIINNGNSDEEFIQGLPADKLIFNEMDTLSNVIGPFHPRVKAVQVNDQWTGSEHSGFGTEVLFRPELEYLWIDTYLQGGYYHLSDTLSDDLANEELAPNLKELHLSIKGSMESLNSLLNAINNHKCLESCEIIWMLTDEERNLDKIDLNYASKIDNFILVVQESDGEVESCPPGFESNESDLIFIKGWSTTQ